MNNLEKRIWARDNRQCRRCHRVVYKTYTMLPQGVIYHVNRDLNDKADSNLILICHECQVDLTRLILEYSQKYLCQMELITQSKLQSLRDVTPKYDIDYRYYKVCLDIQDLEKENNMLVLPSVDREQLIYLKLLKAKIEAAEIREVVNRQ